MASDFDVNSLRPILERLVTGELTVPMALHDLDIAINRRAPAQEPAAETSTDPRPCCGWAISCPWETRLKQHEQCGYAKTAQCPRWWWSTSVSPTGTADEARKAWEGSKR